MDISWTAKNSKHFKETYLSVDCKWTAAQHHVVPPEESTAAYQVFNFRAGTQLRFSGSVLQLRLQVQNLFDKRNIWIIPAFIGLISLPEQGRNFILSIGVPFGKQSRS
jgi:iron complex outermembrane receptor protein